MGQAAITEQVRLTTTDLEVLSENSGLWPRYELINGELFVTKAPHRDHQETISILFYELFVWSQRSKLGRVNIGPGVLFSSYDNVIPDMVWMSNERLAALMDEAGHLTGATELVVEVLSPGARNAYRDCEARLKLYSGHGVQEYWIVDWQAQQVSIYRRSEAALHLTGTLLVDDELRSPLLPGFACPARRLFPYNVTSS